MLEEVLRHENIGNKNELLFFLFDGLSPIKPRKINDLQKYCTSQCFTISRSFHGIIELFKFISFIRVSDEEIEMNNSIFDPITFRKETYFNKFHFFHFLLSALKETDGVKDLFNEDNLKYNFAFNKYYLLESRIPYKYFPLRNLLLSTSFFQRESDLPNQLYINNAFTDEFRDHIIKFLNHRTKPVKKLSLEGLKDKLKRLEELGKIAESFVLRYEQDRLVGHPNLDYVKIISENFTNAGYDLESFMDINSVVIDKFIEVKSYEGEISFYWSKNEVEIAEKLGDKYFLYLVDRSKIELDGYEPRRFQDPYKKIFKSDFWKKETENWKIFYDDV